MKATYSTLCLILLAVPTPACTGDIGPSTAGDGAAQTSLRRLSIAEYDNTIRDLLGDTERPAARYLPEDATTPFDNDTANQVVSGALIDGAESLAVDVAARLLADPARRDQVVGCVPSGADDAICMTQFIEDFGRRVLRRPPSPDEVQRYLALQSFAIESDDFYVGVETVLWAFLQDPEFLYRVELGTPVDGRPGVFRLNSFEIATRLSYLLWGSTPDDWLLDEAAAAEAAGAPFTAADARELAVRMLEDPRARDRIDRFHAMWLGYDSLPHDPQLAEAMRAETRALIERVVFDDKLPWRELFLAEETFLTPLLASHYGLPQPAAPGGDWVSYGDSGRRGILSHGSFLANGGRFEDTSPVMRGIAVKTRLLCQELPSPPPNVNVDDQPVSESPCKWDRFAAYREPGCIECHGQINPTGWGLEQYDREGVFRGTDDAGCDLAPHAQGELFGYGTFSGPGELGELLAEAEEMHRCLGTRLYGFAYGRPGTAPEDAAAIDALMSGVGPDFRFDELLLNLVSSEAFLHRTEEE